MQNSFTFVSCQSYQQNCHFLGPTKLLFFYLMKCKFMQVVNYTFLKGPIQLTYFSNLSPSWVGLLKSRAVNFAILVSHFKFVGINFRQNKTGYAWLQVILCCQISPNQYTAKLLLNLNSLVNKRDLIALYLSWT